VGRQAAAVIGRVLRRGSNLRGVLSYLFSTRNGHQDPHLVAGWQHPAGLEPPLRADGKRSFSRLAGLMELPVKLTRELGRGKVADKFVYHLAVRCAPGDPRLGDGAWSAICAEIMHRTGLSVRGREDRGVPWVAVRHAGDHVHIVAVLATQDNRPAWPRNDYYRLAEALRDIEKEYGLQVLVKADRTAARALTRTEMERSARSGTAPDRHVLYRAVRAAAGAARTEDQFLAALRAGGVQVRLRPSARDPGQYTGYSVALDHGPDARLTWFGGGRLAPDLTLPKLRARWAGPPLTGRGMTGPAARTVLAREALRAARAARSEPEFFALLARAGLTARPRPAPGRPDRAAGWSVTLPGLTDRAGQPVWFGGGTLDQALELGRMRARWRAGQAGAGPGPDYFTGAARSEVYQHAARAAGRAADELRAGRPGRADVAWAAADVLTAAAAATGSPELARAAEDLTRAARAAWGRVPAPSPVGSMLRTAAYLIASCHPTSRPQPARAFRDLLLAIASLARTLAELRAVRDRLQQAAAAAASADRLAAAAAQIEHAGTAPAPAARPAPGLASDSFPAPPRPAPPGPAARPAPRPRPPGPGRGLSR
jgi:hypothetical protein